MTETLPADPRTPDSRIYLEQMGEIRERLDCILWLAYSEKLFKASHDYLLEAMFPSCAKCLS